MGQLVIRRILAVILTVGVTFGSISALAATIEQAENEPPNAWHPPTDHEHGDPPPAWAEQWSMQHFGHGVIYGGDEGTAAENFYKHNAFKGYSFNVMADDGSHVEVYARVHMQTNPHGRSARYHSAEWYFRDSTGAVSMMQWWADFGDLRLSFARAGQDTGRSDNSRLHQSLLLDREVRNTEPLNVVIGYDEESNPGYVEDYTGREFWYAQTSPQGDWMPTFTVDVFDPSTYYMDGEEQAAGDRSTWNLTGDHGLDRNISFRWIAGGSTVRNIQGQPYLTRNMSDPRGWFCATVYGEIVSTGTKECSEGLPQYIAPSLPTIADAANPPREYRHTWECPSCQLPN